MLGAASKGLAVEERESVSVGGEREFPVDARSGALLQAVKAASARS
jgi:hypothetical protein